MYEKYFYLCMKKQFLSLPVGIREKSLCTWNGRDFFIPGAPWGQPELQSPKRCYLSCDDWQTVSFSFNQWPALFAPSTSHHLQEVCETLCTYHIWYFWWLTARISAAGEQCSHWSLFRLGLFFPLCILKGWYTHSNPPRRNNYIIISLKSEDFYVSIPHHS